MISEDEIKIVSRSLKSGKATGPDLINNRVLRELSCEISSPLTKLFNYSLSSGKVPSQWKLANVCAVFKKIDTIDVSNYRPISLLSTISSHTNISSISLSLTTGLHHYNLVLYLTILQ